MFGLSLELGDSGVFGDCLRLDWIGETPSHHWLLYDNYRTAGRLLNVARNYQYVKTMREAISDHRVFADRGDLLDSFKIPPR
jgi:hypothetical protein